MTERKQQDGGVSFFEILVRLVKAVNATISAVRAGQSALRAWQRVVAAVRGDEPQATKKED